MGRDPPGGYGLRDPSFAWLDLCTGIVDACGFDPRLRFTTGRLAIRAGSVGAGWLDAGRLGTGRLGACTVGLGRPGT